MIFSQVILNIKMVYFIQFSLLYFIFKYICLPFLHNLFKKDKALLLLLLLIISAQ